MNLLVATDDRVLAVDPDEGRMDSVLGLDGRPVCLAAHADRAWCGTAEDGVFESPDAGSSWRPVGLEAESITAVAVGPGTGPVWVGTEPSRIWRSHDRGHSWRQPGDLESLPSSTDWAFPPKPDTHHVRWIACHPSDPDRVWVAIEAGALVRTEDGGETWLDRMPGGPEDTHEVAIHPQAPESLRIAAGDGYFASDDGGLTWTSPIDGLDVGYLLSVAIDPGDPDTVVVSAAPSPSSAYVAGRSKGRLFRRQGGGPWQRVKHGWPDPADTIAPLLIAAEEPGEIWAADERGLHVSRDGGSRWERVASYPERPSHLRALTRVDAAAAAPSGGGA